MQKKVNYVGYIGLALMVLFLIGSFTWMKPAEVEITFPTAEEIGGFVIVPQASTYNDTLVREDLNMIQGILDEEDNWKDEAIELATEEFSERDYKDIFKFLDGSEETDIDEKEDIEDVVIKESEVFETAQTRDDEDFYFDVDDKDAVVEQKLKVYYEDKSGEDVKEYITVTTYIEDGEVEYQDFIFY